jgi:hypothetical protein
MNVFLEPAEQ